MSIWAIAIHEKKKEWSSGERTWKKIASAQLWYFVPTYVHVQMHACSESFRILGGYEGFHFVQKDNKTTSIYPNLWWYMYVRTCKTISFLKMHPVCVIAVSLVKFRGGFFSQEEVDKLIHFLTTYKVGRKWFTSLGGQNATAVTSNALLVLENL